MNLAKRTPRTYRHRGYEIQALACGSYRWNLWRPGADLALCEVQTLADAWAVIEADRLIRCRADRIKYLHNSGVAL